MKKLQNDINKVMYEKLGQVEVSMNFEQIWQQYNKERKNKEIKSLKRNCKRNLLIASLLIFSFTAIGATQIVKRIDNIDITFEDDSEIIGYWEAVDFVERPEDFDVNNLQWDRDELYIAQCIFNEGGEVQFVARDEDRLVKQIQTPFRWTNGSIIDSVDQTNSQYEIRAIDGEEYMFIQWKSGDYTYFRIEEPYYYVLKRVDGLLEGIEVPSLRYDNIDIPFEDNPEMIGKWKAVSFVDKIEDFKKNMLKEDLYLEGMEFSEGGKVVFTQGDINCSEGVEWSENKIISRIGQVVMECTLKEIDNKTYLFMEWKSGDYRYSGMEPSYYVFEKQ